MLVFAKLCVFCETCKISLDPSPGVDSIFFRIEVYSVGADIYERVFAACGQDVLVEGHMAVPCRAGGGEVNVEVCGGETRVHFCQRSALFLQVGILIFVSFVLSVGNTLTMSDVSRAFFVPS